MKVKLDNTSYDLTDNLLLSPETDFEESILRKMAERNLTFRLIPSMQETYKLEIEKREVK